MKSDDLVSIIMPAYNAKTCQANLVRQQLTALITLVGHAAELVQHEDLLIPARPRLPENNRPPQLNAHQDGDNGRDWRKLEEETQYHGMKNSISI